MFRFRRERFFKRNFIIHTWWLVCGLTFHTVHFIGQRRITQTVREKKKEQGKLTQKCFHLFLSGANTMKYKATTLNLHLFIFFLFFSSFDNETHFNKILHFIRRSLAKRQWITTTIINCSMFKIFRYFNSFFTLHKNFTIFTIIKLNLRQFLQFQFGPCWNVYNRFYIFCLNNLIFIKSFYNSS